MPAVAAPRRSAAVRQTPASGRELPPAAGRSPLIGRMASLDGLRGLACTGVVCFHVYNVTVPDLSRRDWPYAIRFTLTSLGTSCVIGFFVLSAFLLGQPFLRWLLGDTGRPSIRRYAVHRCLRILPAWWAILALMVAVNAQWLLQQPLELVSFVTLTQNYAGLGHAVVPHGWTLSIEASFYVAAPLAALGLAPLLRGLGRPLRATVIAGALSATVAVAWAYHAGAVPLLQRHQLGLTLPGFLDAFALGGLAALIVILRPDRRPVWLPLILAALAFLAGMGELTRFRYELAAVAFALVILHLEADVGALCRLLSSRPLKHLGRLSYGIYLYHLPLAYLALGIGMIDRGHGVQTVPATVALITASVAAAELSFRLLEGPALGIARRATPRRRATQTEGAAAPATT
jgi:peptidoglycan/LPS O-acetylase OafA/YrhL